ncbi:hypothetical protein [Legionella cardiaca]|uniref:N-acetyltransferase n=1 Tax=Legionella cardiaca TaxID=1071983 RepID=A0ABY8ASS4_9GAMM|nr:hypothetical protein [Legionella cardiaca]WED42826.1 hypothetical protein PXX05_13125 [Legionella cardiaca]
MSFTVVQVSTLTQKRDFIQLPWMLHAKDSNWVPPLRGAVKKILNTRKHPFYKQAELTLWLAYRNNQPVGRIAGIINHAHNQFHNEQIAFWGFFETESNIETARALFAAVEEWAHQKKVHSLRGPANPSINYECGMQVSAFDTKPYIMMTQNPSYYPQLVEALGYDKVTDMYAWLINPQTFNLHTKLKTVYNKLSNSADIQIRSINMKNYRREIEIFLDIYNDAWRENWGFVPMTKAEVDSLAQEMKPLIIPEMALMITVAGEPAAFGIFLPDINEALLHVRNGKLFPTGFIKLLQYIKRPKHSRGGRIPLLGIRKKFRHLQLGILLYAKFGELGRNLNISDTECSWILEDNRSMHFGLKHIGASQYKTYRMYQKTLVNRDMG